MLTIGHMAMFVVKSIVIQIMVRIIELAIGAPVKTICKHYGYV